MLPQEGQECKKGSQNSNLRMTQMGKEEEAEEATLIFQAPCLKKVSMYDTYGEKVIMEEENEEFGSTSSVESSMEDSEDSTICSLSSSEVAEDACSPPSCPPPRSPSSSSPPDGPLFELSELMAQLPIKRGLSRYYQGKSQSYTSLASVKSVEDLQAKKESYNSICHYKMKIKSCRSYGWGLDAHNNNNHRCFSPKATISKKGRPASSRGRVLCLL